MQFCVRTREVLIFVWLLAALVSNAPALQAGEQESQEKDGAEQSRLQFRPLQFVLSLAELLPLHTGGEQ